MEHIPKEFSELALGEKIETDAGILCITLNALEQSTARTDAIVNFRRINNILNECIPRIVDKGGIVINFNHTSSLSLFPKDPGEALSCALSIFSSIERLPEDEKIYFDRISLAICYGNVAVGMVGFKDHIIPLTSSESVLLCSLLQRKASAYSARILTTETFLEQTPTAKGKYNHRMLGVAYMSGSKKREMIFDLFEADEPDIRNLKRRTKNMFEKGVEMFLVNRFADARNYFLEVIRTDRRDLAAKEYLLRCDDYIHGVKDGKADEAVYFEVL